MSQIERLYRTTDGQLFEKSKEAREHQKSLDIEVWYLKDPLAGISCDEFMAWAKKHKLGVVDGD